VLVRSMPFLEVFDVLRSTVTGVSSALSGSLSEIVLFNSMLIRKQPKGKGCTLDDLSWLVRRPEIWWEVLSLRVWEREKQSRIWTHQREDDTVYFGWKGCVLV
jgi:hypothetical protein